MKERLSKEAIEKFKQIMLEDYGLSLTDEEAEEQAEDLLSLIFDVFKSRQNINKRT